MVVSISSICLVVLCIHTCTLTSTFNFTYTPAMGSNPVGSSAKVGGMVREVNDTVEFSYAVTSYGGSKFEELWEERNKKGGGKSSVFVFTLYTEIDILLHTLSTSYYFTRCYLSSCTSKW